MSRRHQSLTGLVPADKCFCAAYFATYQVHFGLVMQHKLATLQCLAQLILQGELAGYQLVHALGIEQIALTAGLGLLEGRLGVSE